MINSALILLTLMGSLATGNIKTTMDEQGRKEVEELHQFFQDWSTGHLDASDSSFERFSKVMADGFEIISPGGGRMTRVEILARVREGHGSSKGTSFRIWIQNYRSRPIGNGLLLVTYEEWQDTDGEKRGRISTAVFQPKSDTPNGLEWLHVHETWLSDGATR